MNASTRALAQDYAYRHVTPKVLSEDMSFRENAPRPGQMLPSFDLPLVDGGRLRSDGLIGDKPMLLITGSYTCPMTASSNPLLKDLHAQFGSRVRFVMLHVREAHPGEQRDQPDSADEKMRHAQDLKQRDGLPWPIAVDDPQGTAHRALDEKPNAAYLTDAQGRIVFRSLWAGDTKGLRQALDSVVRGERPDPQESQRRLMPMARGVGMMREMTQQAGPRAQQDIWQAAAPMAVLAWVADLYRPLPPAGRAFAAAATVSVAAAAVVSLLVRATRQRRFV